MKGILVSAILAILTLVIVGAGYLYFNLFPAAPQITAWGINSTCDPVITFIDKSTNEIGFRISFRPQGASNFTLIKVLPAMAGKGTSASVILSPRVPAGNYDYRVEAFTEYGPASDTQTVNAPVNSLCSDIPALPSGDPMSFLVEPLIVKVTIQNDCDVLVEYLDFNTPQQVQEDGLRIYRNIWNQNKAVIANLPPADNGTYLDPDLPPEDYQYVVSAYKGNTELFSAASYPVDISFDLCLKNKKDETGPLTPTPTLETVTPTSEIVVNLTPKKLSCEWEAAADVFMRKGPDVGLFDRLIAVPKGNVYPIVGQSEDGQFWALEVEPGVIGYITKSEKYSHVTGDCESVSTRTDPEPPEVIPAATKKPGGGSSTPACSDGIDNDGDGLVDYNPFGSGDTGCTSAEGTSE